MESLKEDPVLLEWVCRLCRKKPETLTMNDLHARYRDEMDKNFVHLGWNSCPRFADEEECLKYENASEIHQKFMSLRFYHRAKKAMTWKWRNLEEKELIEWSMNEEKEEKEEEEKRKKEHEEWKKAREEEDKVREEENKVREQKRKKMREEKKKKRDEKKQ